MHAPGGPSAWVERFLAGVKPGGDVLDVACGSGRHLRLARERGLRASGIDRDLTGVADLAGADGVRLIEHDLEDGRPFPLAGERFDGVIVTNYLWRPILPAIVRAVAEDGVLIYETFALGHQRHGKPSNPDFLLRPNELIEAVVPGLVAVAYEHGEIGGSSPRIIQRIAACGPKHTWTKDVPFAVV
jgi:SAM-dependent methyltransferase